MKLFLAATIILFGLLLPARAQQDADGQYIAIYDSLQQAESLADAGESTRALAGLLDAQAKLQQFQKMFPDWNPGIVNFRLKDLAQKIAALKAAAGSAGAPAPAASTNGLSAVQAGEMSAQEQRLRAELQAGQAEIQTLQAKLKEALATQPAAINADALAQAQARILALMKENDLLKANATLERNTNGVAGLRQQLAAAHDQYSQEHSRAEKLAAENARLQRNLPGTGGRNAAALDLLRRENARLKAQLAAASPATNDVVAAAELAARLKAANAQVASLQNAVTVVTLEKDALENRVQQLSAELKKLPATDYDDRIRNLTKQRDELSQQLAQAGRKAPRRAAAELAALTNEVQSLRARLAVDEAKPAPYTPEELALMRQNAPAPDREPAGRSLQALPSGAAELVASAQQHFAKHEYDQAEADYLKILARDQNNGLVLANLATIELQDNKLAEAEKHIKAALAQSPNDAYNLSTLGYLKFREGKYDEALDVLSRAAKIDPNNPEIQNYLGVTLSHKGLQAQAEVALRRAIEINPLYAPAHNNLAVVYLNETPPMPLLARWHYEKAVAAGQPRNPDLEKLLAEKGAPVDQQ